MSVEAQQKLEKDTAKKEAKAEAKADAALKKKMASPVRELWIDVQIISPYLCFELSRSLSNE